MLLLLVERVFLDALVILLNDYAADEYWTEEKWNSELGWGAW
jgi:hypothetical protein